MTAAFYIHLAATWTLVGLIWTMQIVAYPQFLRVGESEFVDFHFGHCGRVGLLVTPLLAIEAGSAAWLLYWGHREWVFLVSVGLILVNWLSTAIWQGPLHTKLMKGFDADVVRRLIQSNWVRTLSWTVRGVLVASMVA